MTRPRNALLATALVTCLPLGARAQTAGNPLTLDEAIRTALAQNASLAAARASAAEASSRAAEARALFFPRVSFTESWRRGDEPVFVFSSLLSARRFAPANFAIDALNHPGAVGFFQTSVGIEQLLFDGGARRSAARGATLRTRLAEAGVDQAAVGLSLAVTETFGRILASEAARRAIDAAMAAAREDLARAERRRDVGMATDADALALMVHVADLHQRAIRTEGEAAIARAELNRLMGAPIDRTFQIVAPAIADIAVTGNVATLLAEAEASRPETKRAILAEQLAELERGRARSALVPQIAAQAMFDVSGTRFDNRARGWLVGGELRWTFSTGGAELARLSAAAHAAARARAERDDARATVHVGVVSALRRLETARARQAAGRAAVDQARESQRIVRNRFDAGLAGVNDVLLASAAELEAEQNNVSALVDAIVSRAMLDRALGRPVRFP